METKTEAEGPLHTMGQDFPPVGLALHSEEDPARQSQPVLRVLWWMQCFHYVLKDMQTSTSYNFAL